ncbi:C10 family peptidase [Allomuricauda sp. F6463D]|uniref:C10 family peptidase n=1 Tax=Allomuricauda sp. F6463D TaxID=2926409 RepID=UPI001FF612C5|nr:C10 family peptidase [Muricauda sp. F6463D]MCK0160452.1 C10 family peptidase [Muricauda sp. F6463D]
MKAKLFFLALIFIVPFCAQSQINKNELFEYTNGFIEIQQLNKTTNLEPAGIQELRNTNNTLLAYVVSLKPKGFVVFAPSKDFYPVISFSDESNFHFQDSPDNTLLGLIKGDMENSMASMNRKSNKELSKEKLKNRLAWERLTTKKTVGKSPDTYSVSTSSLVQHGKILSSVWGGVNCYDQNSLPVYVGNYYTPNHYSPGCVATSLSMILHYYEWPETGVGSHTNYDNQGSSQTSWTANFGNAQYDYANMLDEYMYQPSSLAQQKAMGYISFHTATALDMDYEASGSTSHINRIPDAADSYFRFSGHYQTPSWASFWDRLRENIENEHPVPLAIYATNGSGHAPVCDGYRYNEGDPESEYYYHLNMGWWGTNNAWYRLQNSFNAGGYTSVTGAVFDLLPDPVFTETTSSGQKTFTLNWKTSNQLNWDAFELQESVNGGSFTTLDNNITSTSYTRTVSSGGTYTYRVRAKTDGNYYLNSYSVTKDVEVPYDITFLDFDGNDSFFVYDNSNNDFDVSSTYTIETWVKVDSKTSNTYPVIMDRKTVFSLFLIDDTNGDYAIKFAARDASGNIIASVQSDASSVNLTFDEWVHVAVTRSGNTTKLYLNGQLTDTSNDSGFALTASTNALNIGARYWNGYERYIDGKIDKIRISDIERFNTNFTPDILETYVADANTRILLAMDEGAGTDLTDDAGNFNTVTLRSSPNQPNWMFEDFNQIASKQALTINDASPLKLPENEDVSMSMVQYPNPTQNQITYMIESAVEQESEIVIYNTSGSIVKRQKSSLISGNNSLTVDISSLRVGIYYTRIQTADTTYKSTFIKK